METNARSKSPGKVVESESTVKNNSKSPSSKSHSLSQSQESTNAVSKKKTSTDINKKINNATVIPKNQKPTPTAPTNEKVSTMKMKESTTTTPGTTTATVVFKTPTKNVVSAAVAAYSKNTKRGVSPIVDSSPIQSTHSLVQKWEKTKEIEGKNEKVTTTKTKISSTVEMSAAATAAAASISKMKTPKMTETEVSVNEQTTPASASKQVKNIMDETKIVEDVPALTRKFSFKENRIREAAKDYNKKANNVNIDLKNKEIPNTKLQVKKKISNLASEKKEKNFEETPVLINSSSSASTSTTTTPTSPTSSRKRVFTEDNNERKSQRSKRLRISDLTNPENTLWKKVNSSIKSLKNSLSLTRNNSSSTTEEESNDTDTEQEDIYQNKEKKTELVRIDEPTCLNIFRPSINVRSSMPMRLRIRRRRNSENNTTDSSSSLIYIPFFKKNITKPNWTNKLYMVIGNENKSPKLFEVPAHWTSLSSQMVYLLDLSGEAIIQYNGSKSQKIEKEYAKRVGKRLLLHENISDIFEIDQDVSYVSNTTPLKLFWKAMDLENYSENERRKICTKNDQIKLSVVLEEAKRSIDIEKSVYIYRINEQTKSSDLIHCGSFPTYKCLNSSVSIIFDFSGEIFLWQGKNSSLNTRSLGIKFAQKIFSDYSRPSWAVLKKINEGHEPVIFQEKFEDSYLFF